MAMAAVQFGTKLPAREDRKIYIVWIGLVWAAILAGFGLDFTRFLGESPPPPLILHLHAGLYVSWLILVSAQIFLVERDKIKLHKQLGWATVIVSALMVPSGLIAAMVDQHRQMGHPDYAPQFLSLEFEEMVGFSTCLVAGILTRRNPAEHKRFMILAAVAISDAGSARFWQMAIKWSPAGPFGWWLSFFWGISLILIAMLAWDLIVHKRVMRATVVGAAVLWGGEIVATILNFNPGWKALMVAAVKAWGGWAG